MANTKRKGGSSGSHKKKGHKVATANGTLMTMKLLVDTKAQRVVYAEAGKDVVDFLFSLLTLPVGTVVKLLGTDTMVGSVGNLYGSVEKLDDTYIVRENAKKALLAPAAGCESGNVLQLPEAEAPETDRFFRCSSFYYSDCYNNVTKVNGTPCSHCKNSMGTEMQLVVPTACSDGGAVSAAAGTGFVQGIVTYTVMDDLKVSPMSSISGITMLNTFGVTDIGSLQEKTVQLGYEEGLEILKASLQSKTVLTDVFLPKKRKG
ncbi:hypothetical protein CFC21_039969 [Triticum aestivum]|uniref:DUF674 domain-containing protein n=2 Tax=Triticum aestivum TaxID=4565 RepID=A0A9R1FFT4_WHEAT|nr:hypothetical protein CFC21_039969 [Triticum aestivum]CDM81392.1 unnamed protein product [Triticum aestivum]